MTQEELQAIRERCENATPGPWKFDSGDRYQLDNGSEYVISGEMYGNYAGLGYRYDDGEFISNARTDLPKALDEIERQAKEIERLKYALTMIRNIKSRDHNNQCQRLQYIDNIACQALGGDFMADTYVDEENERLRGALELIASGDYDTHPSTGPITVYTAHEWHMKIARQALEGTES